jgi:hypothetical protein
MRKRVRKMVVVLTGALQTPLAVGIGYHMASGDAVSVAALMAALILNQYFHEALKQYWIDGGEK